jgi:hypothetical protein
MAFLGKREGLAQKVDTAAIEAERLGLTTATLILRMARLEIDRAEPDEVESMPRNNSAYRCICFGNSARARRPLLRQGKACWPA